MKLFSHTEITWIVCIVSLTSLQLNPALARHRHHEKPVSYTYGYYISKGLVVPIPRPRDDRVTPAEGKALADYLLPKDRINEAFSALEDR